MKKKEEKQANNEFRRHQRILAKCKFWFNNEKVFGDNIKLVIAHSDNIYLSVPTDIGTIHKYHFVISPKDHYSGINLLDEDVALEIRNFKKSLVAYFAAKKKSMIFLETAWDQANLPHIQIDWIPVDYKLDEDVKKYFKRTLTEDDSEWSDHKKLIDSEKAKGDISQVIPKNFDYFHLDINSQGGFAHIIEDSSKINRKHVLEVLAGCMGEEVNVNVPLRYEALRKRVKEFKEKFHSKFGTVFNFTK